MPNSKSKQGAPRTIRASIEHVDVLEALTKETFINDLRRIAVLLQIVDKHKDKARHLAHLAAYVQTSKDSLTTLLANINHIPGVGPAVAQVVAAWTQGGLQAAIVLLDISIPPTVADFVRLPGIGVKTANSWYFTYHLHTLADVQHALKQDPLGTRLGLKQIRQARLQRDLEVLLSRQHAWPIAKAWPTAQGVEHELKQIHGVANVTITGSLRRFHTMVSDLSFVVTVHDSHHAIATWCATHGEVVEHTEKQIRFWFPQTGGDRICVQIFIANHRESALTLMRSTGDETHQAVMEGLIHRAGYLWRGDKMQTGSGQVVEVATEADLYALVGMAWLLPELREGSGMLQNAKTLVHPSDIRGDLHMHSTWSDGLLSIAELAERAEQLGYEYIAITDHSPSLHIAGGLSIEALRQQRLAIEDLRQRTRVHILHGTEVDILPNGQLDLPNEELAQLDIVIASVHSAFHQSKADMTNRFLRALDNPYVDVLGHLHGRVIGKRSGYLLDTPQVLSKAAEREVMVELNANPNRLDIWDEWLRVCVEQGIYVPINTDTHHPHELNFIDYGVHMATRGWLPTSQVPNTWSYAKLMRHLRATRARRLLKR